MNYDNPGRLMELDVWCKCEYCGRLAGEFRAYPDMRYICEKCRERYKDEINGLSV